MTKFNVGDVVINIYNPSTIGTISSFSSTTYSMLLFTGGYFTFPVSLESMYRLATSEEIPGSTPKFSVGDILANYTGGLDKPAFEVVDNTNGVYRLRQIPSGNYFTWNYATVERANALYAPSPTDPCAGITCPNTCDGTSLYSQKCVNGHCVKDALIESNSPTCGYTTPAPTPTPAKGEVYNLNYPASAENGETITINASVLNKGGTSGEFSLRLIAAPQMVLVTRYVGWIAPYRFSVLESLSVTMPSSGSTANLGVQCIRHT